MAQLTNKQRTFIRVTALLIGLVSMVVIVMAILGYTELPFTIPLLLLAAASGLMLASRPSKKSD